MSLDGIMVHQLQKELSECLVRGRINKIQHPYAQEIVMSVRAYGKTYKVLLSAHAQYARIHCTEVPYENPEAPSTFCMTLRKYLEGGIIEALTQVENDRIIEIVCTKRDDLGDAKKYRLILEMMGRHSNLLLVDVEKNKIIDCIKHVPFYQNSYRSLLPGATYVPAPQQEKLNPFTVSSEQIFCFLHEEELSSKNLQQHFQGLGRDTANELALRLKEGNKSAAWQQFFVDLNNGQPCLIEGEEDVDFVPFAYQSIMGQRQFFATYSELLDAYFYEKAEVARVKQQVGVLAQRLQHEMQKNTQKIQKLEQQLKEAEEAEHLRQYGELLTTYLHEVPKGATEVSLPNYYENNQPVTISLNPAYSPSKNAQKYFQKYQKLKKSVKIVSEQITEAKMDNAYMDSVLSQIHLAKACDLPALQEEFLAQAWIKPKKNQRKQVKKIPPLQFMSSAGHRILVGRNNLQNDRLSLKTANKNAYWFHAKNIPGSHVILETSQPTKAECIEAAELAAYYSKYRQAANVPVDYIQVRHLRKPKGAKPGFVVYEGQKTLVVTPDEKKVEALRDDHL